MVVLEHTWVCGSPCFCARAITSAATREKPWRSVMREFPSKINRESDHNVGQWSARTSASLDEVGGRLRARLTHLFITGRRSCVLSTLLTLKEVAIRLNI